MKDIHIRKFRKEDKSQIMKMFVEFGHYFKKIDNLKLCRVAPNYADYFFEKMRRKAKEKDGIIFVAERKNVLIGFIAGCIQEVNKKNPEEVFHKDGMIFELFIQENFRGKGIGTKFLKYMEQYFRKKKCDFMDVEVFGPNKKAYQFYKNFGFDERNYHLRKKI